MLNVAWVYILMYVVMMLQWVVAKHDQEEEGPRQFESSFLMKIICGTIVWLTLSSWWLGAAILLMTLGVRYIWVMIKGYTKLALPGAHIDLTTGRVVTGPVVDCYRGITGFSWLDGKLSSWLGLGYADPVAEQELAVSAALMKEMRRMQKDNEYELANQLRNVEAAARKMEIDGKHELAKTIREGNEALKVKALEARDKIRTQEQELLRAARDKEAVLKQTVYKDFNDLKAHLQDRYNYKLREEWALWQIKNPGRTGLGSPPGLQPPGEDFTSMAPPNWSDSLVDTMSGGITEPGPSVLRDKGKEREQKEEGPMDGFDQQVQRYFYLSDQDKKKTTVEPQEKTVQLTFQDICRDGVCSRTITEVVEVYSERQMEESPKLQNPTMDADMPKGILYLFVSSSGDFAGTASIIENLITTIDHCVDPHVMRGDTMCASLTFEKPGTIKTLVALNEVYPRVGRVRSFRIPHEWAEMKLPQSKWCDYDLPASGMVLTIGIPATSPFSKMGAIACSIGPYILDTFTGAAHFVKHWMWTTYGMSGSPVYISENGVFVRRVVGLQMSGGKTHNEFYLVKPTMVAELRARSSVRKAVSVAPILLDLEGPLNKALEDTNKKLKEQLQDQEDQIKILQLEVIKASDVIRAYNDKLIDIQVPEDKGKTKHGRGRVHFSASEARASKSRGFWGSKLGEWVDYGVAEDRFMEMSNAPPSEKWSPADYKAFVQFMMDEYGYGDASDDSERTPYPSDWMNKEDEEDDEYDSRARVGGDEYYATRQHELGEVQAWEAATSFSAKCGRACAAIKEQRYEQPMPQPRPKPVVSDAVKQQKEMIRELVLEVFPELGAQKKGEAAPSKKTEHQEMEEPKPMHPLEETQEVKFAREQADFEEVRDHYMAQTKRAVDAIPLEEALNLIEGMFPKRRERVPPPVPAEKKEKQTPPPPRERIPPPPPKPTSESQDLWHKYMKVVNARRRLAMDGGEKLPHDYPETDMDCVEWEVVRAKMPKGEKIPREQKPETVKAPARKGKEKMTAAEFREKNPLTPEQKAARMPSQQYNKLSKEARASFLALSIPARAEFIKKMNIRLGTSSVRGGSIMVDDLLDQVFPSQDGEDLS